MAVSFGSLDYLSRLGTLSLTVGRNRIMGADQSCCGERTKEPKARIPAGGSVRAKDGVILDKDGKEVFFEDGKPMVVEEPPDDPRIPTGGSVRKFSEGGAILDKDGKPVLDKDKKPMCVAPPHHSDSEEEDGGLLGAAVRVASAGVESLRS